MPYGRKKFRRRALPRRKPRFAHKGRKKVRKSTRPSQVVIKQPSGVPDRLFVKLILRATVSAGQLSGNLGYLNIAGNTLYDPLAASGTAQPYFFDQWTALYAYYRVLGSKINVSSMMNDSANGPNAPIVGIVATSAAAPSWGTSDHSLIETQPYAKRRPVRMGARGVGTLNMQAYRSTAKMRGVTKKAIMTEDNYRGTASADATDLWHWTVFNYDSGGNTQSMIQDILVTYYVVFEGRNIPAVSTG